MNISETKSILIEAHEQLCSFAKSLYSLGFDEDYFDFEFEWIQMCVGLCEIYSTSTDEFVKSRALKKLNAFLENDNSDAQLSFNFADSAMEYPFSCPMFIGYSCPSMLKHLIKTSIKSSM